MSSIQKIFLGYSNYGYYDEEELMYEGCANIFDDDGFVFGEIFEDGEIKIFTNNELAQSREISKEIFEIYKESFFEYRRFGDFDDETKMNAVIQKIEVLLMKKVYGKNS